MGMHGSAENPKGTLLYVEPGWVKCFGTVAEPIHPWRFNKGDGCQMAVVYPGEDSPGEPMLKTQIWLSSFDLSNMELRCRNPLALAGSSHEHRQVRGRMQYEGKSVSVASYSGAYTPVQGTL